MGFKDMLVTADAGAAARSRVELAAALAERCGAHLIGLHTAMQPLSPTIGRYFEYFGRSSLDPPYREFADRLNEWEEASRTLFGQIVDGRPFASEWRTSTGYPSETAALHGRYVSLIVLGQLDPHDAEGALYRPFPEEVALAVGRPVLVVPYAGTFAEVGQRVLIAWDGSRTATRAVNDAMPLLVAAETVTVLCVDPDQDRRAHGEVPGSDIAVHLARHGVKARVETTISGGIGVGNTLLSSAADSGADLLVMGAYGHARIRELLLGGATRTILESMTLPVLMSH